MYEDFFKKELINQFLHKQMSDLLYNPTFS